MKLGPILYQWSLLLVLVIINKCAQGLDCREECTNTNVSVEERCVAVCENLLLQEQRKRASFMRIGRPDKNYMRTGHSKNEENAPVAGMSDGAYLYRDYQRYPRPAFMRIGRASFMRIGKRYSYKRPSFMRIGRRSMDEGGHFETDTGKSQIDVKRPSFMRIGKKNYADEKEEGKRANFMRIGRAGGTKSSFMRIGKRSDEEKELSPQLAPSVGDNEDKVSGSSEIGKNSYFNDAIKRASFMRIGKSTADRKRASFMRIG